MRDQNEDQYTLILPYCTQEHLEHYYDTADSGGPLDMGRSQQQKFRRACQLRAMKPVRWLFRHGFELDNQLAVRNTTRSLRLPHVTPPVILRWDSCTI